MTRPRRKPQIDAKIAPPPTSISTEQTSWPSHARWWIVAAFAIVVPLFISLQGDDTFRLPKELLIRAEAILLAALILASFIRGDNPLRAILRDRLTSIAVASVIVAGILATLFSTNRAISIAALGYALSLVIVFGAMYETAADRSLSSVIAIGVGPAVLNAFLAIGQRVHWWSIFTFPAAIPPRERATALIGNPNEVGACLAVCAVAMIAFAIVSRNLIGFALAALLLIGVVVADALTALIAIIVTGVVIAWMLPRRAAAITTAALGALALAGFLFLPPLRTRVQTLVNAVRTQDYDRLTSHRAIAFVSAWQMFRDHPLAGAGPGTFKFHYLPYRLRIEMEHPNYYLKFVQNMGEVHNDHLQVLAEEGALGFGSLLLCVFVLGSRSFAMRKAAATDIRARFVYFAAFPLVVCWALLALGAFPLELPAVMTPLLFFAAYILRRSHDAAAT
jgi:O-antigen ligase